MKSKANLIADFSYDCWQMASDETVLRLVGQVWAGVIHQCGIVQECRDIYMARLMALRLKDDEDGKPANPGEDWRVGRA